MFKNSLPSSVTYIDKEAFKGCSSLKELNLSDKLTAIGAYAFEGCTSLSKIYLGRGMERISKDAFNGCKDGLKVSISAYSLLYKKLRDLIENKQISSIQDYFSNKNIQIILVDKNDRKRLDRHIQRLTKSKK